MPKTSKGSLNKFLKNKNTVTILGVIACVAILYAGYNMRINTKTALVTVYYANQTIQPKTKITSEMISKTSVPASFILGTYYKNYEQIVGKFSNYNTIIAEGSLFYSDLLVEEENLPDAILYDVNAGEKIVSYPVNTVSTYGNSMMPGNIVDIYVKLVTAKNDIVYGKLFEKVEILAVKDSAGKNVFENTEEARTPAYIYFSLPEAKYLLFTSLTYIEEYFSVSRIEIALVPNTVEYQEDATATEVTSEYLYDFILDKIEQIDDQKELYNELINEIEQSKVKENNQTNTQNNQ